MRSARLGIAVAASAATAHAGPFEVFGLGPEAVAEVSARSASASDGTASFYNPGGLAFGDGYRLRLGGTAAASHLETQNRIRPIDDPWGAFATIDLDVPLEGPLADRIRVGFAMQSPLDNALHLITRDASTPLFPYFDNRTQRLQLIPAVAARLHESVGVGLGANILAGVSGPVDVREGQSRTLESRIEQEVGTVVALVAGLRLDPSPEVHLALVYRQAFGIPVEVTTTADVAGVPLLVDVTATDALFDPTTVVLAGRVDASADVSLEVDVSYQRWSSWKGPLLDLDTEVSALSLSTHRPEGLFRDTIGGRGAIRWEVQTRPQQLMLHGGLGFETSMLRSDVRQGRTNMVDGSKVLFGAGFSVRFPRLLGDALRAGVGVQAQGLTRFEQNKLACTRVPCPSDTVFGPDTNQPDQQITNPGYPTLSGDGFVLVTSFGVGVDL